MKIIIERNNSEIQFPVVTINTDKIHYPYAIRNAIILALEIEGYSQQDIHEIFNIQLDTDKPSTCNDIRQVIDDDDELKNYPTVDEILNVPLK